MADLLDALNYDPATGQFTWKPGQRFAGKPAGMVHRKLGYVVIRYQGKSHYAHRLAWYLTHGHWPGYIDHINGTKDDNRLVNLRQVSKKENHRNMRRFSNSTSGTTGVAFHSQIGKWRAYITHNSRQHALGCFATQEEAIAARKAAEPSFGFHPNHGRA